MFDKLQLKTFQNFLNATSRFQKMADSSGNIHRLFKVSLEFKASVVTVIVLMDTHTANEQKNNSELTTVSVLGVVLRCTRDIFSSLPRNELFPPSSLQKEQTTVAE